MNGVCCVYQMHEEKELREAMRRDIREEWKLQRQREFEAAQRRRHYKMQSEKLRRDALEKRHRLLEAVQNMSGSKNTERDQICKTVKRYNFTMDDDDLSLTYSLSMDSFPSLLDEEIGEGENPQEGL